MQHRSFSLTQGGGYGVCALLILLSACSRYIDATEVETLIATEFPIKTGLNVVSVICPPKEPIAMNERFPCAVTLEDEQSLDVWVTQQDDQGQVKWDASEGIRSLKNIIDNDLLAQEITDGIFAQTEIPVQTDCGAPFRLAKKNEVFSCTTTDIRKQTSEIRVVVEDDAGAVSWGL